MEAPPKLPESRAAARTLALVYLLVAALLPDRARTSCSTATSPHRRAEQISLWKGLAFILRLRPACCTSSGADRRSATVDSARPRSGTPGSWQSGSQERTAELEQSRAELEAFSYSVSHDLRAPLRAVEGFSQALLEDYGDRFDDTGRDYAERLVGAAHNMDALIRDLLAYSQLSRTEMPLVQVSLEEVVGEVLATMQAEVTERQAPGWRWSPSCPR